MYVIAQKPNLSIATLTAQEKREIADCIDYGRLCVTSKKQAKRFESQADDVDGGTVSLDRDKLSTEMQCPRF